MLGFLPLSTHFHPGDLLSFASSPLTTPFPVHLFTLIPPQLFHSSLTPSLFTHLFLCVLIHLFTNIPFCSKLLMNSNNKDNCHPLSSHCVPQAGLAALCTLSFFFFGLFRATPTAYGGSQARGLIRAVAAGLPQPQQQQRGI